MGMVNKREIDGTTTKIPTTDLRVGDVFEIGTEILQITAPVEVDKETAAMTMRAIVCSCSNCDDYAAAKRCFRCFGLSKWRSRSK